MDAPRRIVHVDLDAFYASVEQRDRPELRGRPVIVGGHPTRGVVLAASYEVRRFGVKSAMPMVQALRLCRDAIVVRPRMTRYAEVSAQFFEVLRSFTPLVEGLALDEAFLDVTAVGRLFGDGPEVARRIKARVREELGLTVSAGVAANKFVAKIASDLGKPDGLVVVPAGEERAFLAPLPVGRLWGVGKVTEEKLVVRGLRHIGELAEADPVWLAAALGGNLARHLRALARGIDDRAVEAERAPVSIGHEDTFDVDHRHREPLSRALLDQADRACARLRQLGLAARVVTVKVKYADHQRLSRRTSLAEPTTDPRAIGRRVLELFARVPDVERRGVRLTGVSLSELSPRRLAVEGEPQLWLDETEPRERRRGEALGDALDRIAARFGRGAVRRAVHLAEGVPHDEQ